MFKPTSPQLSLFEPNSLFPGILPDSDWSFIYREKIWPLIDEDKFKHLHQEEGGAPNKSIQLKLSLLIFMALEKLTWREAERMYRTRIDWMNATFTPFGQNFIDHTTLFKFYQILDNDDAAYQLFCDLTSAFIAQCNVSTKRQRVDSFFMLGWLARLSRYGLFKETIRIFLQALRKHKPGLYESIRNELSRDYLQDEFDLTEKEKEKANRKIKEMAQDLYYLKSAFENHHQVKHYETFKVLVSVFEQQCAVKEHSKDSDSKRKTEVESDDNDNNSAGNSTVEIELREKPRGDKIISSPHNTDAEYTKKRKQVVVGHKGFLTETCDPENEAQFITDVNLETATHSDAKEISEIETRLEDNGFKPEDLAADAGFVNGESILESQARGIDLIGPSAGRSQSIEDFTRDDRPFDMADFKVEIADESDEIVVLSCPAGQEPFTQKRSNKADHVLVHFGRNVCSQCPSQDRCPVKIGKRHSTVTISEAQYAGAARHHQYMNDTEYRKQCAIRAGAESLVNEVANGHGARRSRHKTEGRSRLQLLFASIGCNVKRYMRYMERCVQNPPQEVKLTV
jgi:hypothetical protein